MKKELRVMHIVETMDIGGAESVIANIVNNMAPEIVSYICCLKHSGDTAEKVKNDVKIFELGKAEGNNYAIPFKLGKILKQNAIDVLHTHNWGVFLEGMVAAIYAGVSVKIHMAHGSLHSHKKNIGGQIKKYIRRKIEKFFTFFCDRVISVSEELRELLKKEIGIKNNKIEVIPNGVMVDRPVINTERIDKELNIDKKKDYIVGFVGRLARVKNIPLLVNAISGLHGKYPNLRLIIVGDGPERNTIEEMIEAKGLESNITMLGARSDVYEILSICDLFVLPSFSEGISISLLEAMSSRLPVLATNVGGNKEVVQHHNSGILINSNDLEEMRDGLEWFLNNGEQAKIYGINGYHHLCQKYNLKDNIKKIEDIYRTAFKNNKMKRL